MAAPLATGAGKTLARGLIYKATVGCKSSSALLEAEIPIALGVTRRVTALNFTAGTKATSRNQKVRG
jgi:hypothetical protein